jgi:hypothetical protein
LAVHRRFGGICSLYIQGRKRPSKKAELKKAAEVYLKSAFTLLSYSIFYFDPENGGYIFLRNCYKFSTDYTALCPKRDIFLAPLYFQSTKKVFNLRD